jgi:hypothetical protein
MLFETVLCNVDARLIECIALHVKTGLCFTDCGVGEMWFVKTGTLVPNLVSEPPLNYGAVNMT